MSVIIFLVIIAVLVFVHELGHFLMAKKFGVRVDEFGLGFPPTIWKKKVGETTYSINAIPFGGFVKIFGENPDGESISGPDSGRSFVNIAKWKQALVLASGVLFNVIFAWLLFSIAYMSGMTTVVSEKEQNYVQNKHVAVLDVLTGSPADAAGLKAGDQLVALSSVGKATTTIMAVAQVQDAVKASQGKPVAFAVKRDGGEIFLSTIPKTGVTGDVYAIGVSMDLVGTVVLPPHRAVWEGAQLAGSIFVGIAKNLYTLAHNAVIGQGDFSQVSGPVGIARLAGDASKLGFIYLLSFTGFISLNLAVLNLIPFPALDGGRILFVAIEAIRRKAISPAVANMTNAVGFGILILLMLFLTYRDILKIWR
jgi:regulator of sigma E protease